MLTKEGDKKEGREGGMKEREREKVTDSVSEGDRERKRDLCKLENFPFSLWNFSDLKI